MGKHEAELEEQRSKLSNFKLLQNLVMKQEIYRNVIAYEQTRNDDRRRNWFRHYLKTTYDKKMLEVLREHKNQIISAVNKDGINSENAIKLNEKLDDLLTEKFYGYVNGEICSRSPSNPEEVKSRIKKCVSELMPLNICVIYGGNKENDEHVADDFDIMAIERMLNLVPYGLYPLDVKILFCDSHATQINKVPEKFVKKYKESLETILNSYMCKDEHSHFYYAHNTNDFGGISFEEEPHRIKLHSLSEILESCDTAYKFYSEDDTPSKEDFVSFVPIAAKLPELKKEGKTLAEDVMKDPAKAELLKKRVALHYKPPIAEQIVEKFESLLGDKKDIETEVSKQYIADRYLHSKLMSEWYQFDNAIFVSFGDKNLETIFSDLPTIFIRGSSKFDNCPWFLDAKKLSYKLMIGSRAIIETVSSHDEHG